MRHGCGTNHYREEIARDVLGHREVKEQNHLTSLVGYPSNSIAHSYNRSHIQYQENIESYLRSKERGGQRRQEDQSLPQRITYGHAIASCSTQGTHAMIHDIETLWLDRKR